MKKILILGNGAREHVIAETLKRSAQEVELYVFGDAKNPGLAELATEYALGKVTDLDAVCAFTEAKGINFAIPGPEAPIAAGAADRLAEMGIPSVAPMQTVARLESSKSFTRDLLQKYAIPGNPKYRVFTSADGLEAYMREDLDGQFVVKADGLKGGKGVKVVGDHLADVAEGVAYASECIEDEGHVVIEEKFVGQEFSLMSFVDGDHVVDMPAIQDHKRAYVNDEGPNTGGMGTYSDANHSLPFLTKADVLAAHEITVQVAKALYQETGQKFKGIMYGGFIAVKDGVRLIEYNARFGDPEAMNALPLLKTDFVDLCEALIQGKLDQIDVEFEEKATVCKYVVPKGYPESPVKGEQIEVSDVPNNVRAYYGSVDQRDDKLYLSGSRAIAFVGMGKTIAEAEEAAQRAVSSVSGPVFFREDIGTAPLIQKRVEMMKALRG